MQFLANVVSWIFPDFKLQWLVDETKRNLPCELDFMMEGQNAEKTAKLMQHLPWLHVTFELHYTLIAISYDTHFDFQLSRYQKCTGISPLQESSQWNSAMA